MCVHISVCVYACGYVFVTICGPFLVFGINTLFRTVSPYGDRKTGPHLAKLLDFLEQ